MSIKNLFMSIYILISCIVVLLILVGYYGQSFAGSDYPPIIKCLNLNNGELKNPINQTKKGCRLGSNYTTIRLPSENQMKILKKYYTEDQIINRLPIFNHESQFDPYAIGGNDYGLLQIHGAKELLGKIEEQIERLVQEDKSVLSEKRCGKYWEQDNTVDGYKKGEEAVIACRYRIHNGAYSYRYAKHLMKLRKIYINYFKSPTPDDSKYIKK